MLGDPGSGWQRLHPASPVVRAAGPVLTLLFLIATTGTQGGGAAAGLQLYEFAIIALVVVMGVIRWLVTRWKLDGATLRIETGLLRRSSRQLPLTRIQAVDIVRPLLGRLFGLAELRIRLAGAGSATGRLAYLAEPVALDLRARLLAGHHGLDPATPEPAEQALATVPTDRLVASVLLSPATLLTLALATTFAVLLGVSPTAAAAEGGTTFLVLLGLSHHTWRRINDQYGFAVGHAADGIRVRRGLLSTVAETIPLQRVQAVRRVEPLLWRPFGWCHLQVDVAGSPGREQETRSGSITRALLPVGPADVADGLLRALVGLHEPRLTPPPRRALWKAPFSFHFLAAGLDDAVVAASTGRVRRVTTWVPVTKIQSIRSVQGPAQRLLRLASVHADAAGRHVRAELRDRDPGEASELAAALAAVARAARRRDASSGLRTGPTPAAAGAAPSLSVAPSGWYPDPSMRHRHRWWDGATWTAHVAGESGTGIDAL